MCVAARKNRTQVALKNRTTSVLYNWRVEKIKKKKEREGVLGGCSGGCGVDGWLELY